MSQKNVFPFFLLAIFVIVLISNLVFRDPNIYPIVRLIPFIISISLGIASTIYAANAYGFSSKHGRALLIIAIGMYLVLSGDLSFVILGLSGKTIPLPSFADALYISGYFFFLLGFFLETRLYKIDFKSVDLSKKIIVGLFILILGILILYLEVFSTYEAKISLFANLARMSYGIFDFFLIAIVTLTLRMSLSFGKGQFFLPWLVIFFAILSSMIGDLIYALFFDKYLMAIWPYTMLNIFWVGAYLLVSFGFLGIGKALREAQENIKITKATLKGINNVS